MMPSVKVLLAHPETEELWAEMDLQVRRSAIESAVLYGDFAAAERQIRWYVEAVVARNRRRHVRLLLGFRKER